MAANTESNSTIRTGDDGRYALQAWVCGLSQVPHGEYVDAFWNNTTVVSPSGQAAIAALFYGELLDCKGKPGSVKWYIGARWMPFTKVSSVLAVFLWYLFFLTIFMPILFTIGSKESYQIAIGFSVIGFIGYCLKGFLYSAYKLLITAVPGNMNQTAFFIKFGLYHMGWMTCVIMFIIAYRGLSSGDLEVHGFGSTADLIKQWLEATAVNVYYNLVDFSSGWWAYTKRWFKLVGAFIVMAYIVGATVSPSDRPSLSLLKQYNQFNRYIARGATWVEQAGVGVVYALLLSIYAGLHVMHPFFT